MPARTIVHRRTCANNLSRPQHTKLDTPPRNKTYANATSMSIYQPYHHRLHLTSATFPLILSPPVHPPKALHHESAPFCSTMHSNTANNPHRSSRSLSSSPSRWSTECVVGFPTSIPVAQNHSSPWSCAHDQTQVVETTYPSPRIRNNEQKWERNHGLPRVGDGVVDAYKYLHRWLAGRKLEGEDGWEVARCVEVVLREVERLRGVVVALERGVGAAAAAGGGG